MMEHTKISCDSVFSKWYRIAKCAAKLHFCKAKSTLYRKVVLINCVFMYKHLNKCQTNCD